MEEISYWTELQGNAFSRFPTPVMALNPEGEVILCKTLLKGEKRGQGGKVRRIRFDRNFVIAYIVKVLLSPLRLNHRYDLALELFNEAYRQYYPDVEIPESKVVIPENIKRYKLHGKEVIRVEDLVNHEN